MAGINVSSTVKLNMPALNELTENAEKALIETATELFTAVKNAEVFPFDTGNLQNEGTFLDIDDSDKGIVRLVSDTPYARRLYYNPEQVPVREYTKRNGQHVKAYIAGKATFNHSDHAYAKDHWYEDWLPGGSQEDFAEKTFAEIFRRLNGL